MLKTYPTTFLLPKRLKLASLVPSQTSALSTDASFSPQQDPRQPILLASHQAMSQARTDSPPRSQRALTYFPLGYKEAAQQWVRLLSLSLSLSLFPSLSPLLATAITLVPRHEPHR